MKHFHPHTPRIEYLGKQIAQDEMLLEDYRLEQARDTDRATRHSIKYTDLKELYEQMRSRTGKMKVLTNAISRNKKELEILQGSAESAT